MAGVKGMKGGGGKREGAGRPPAPPILVDPELDDDGEVIEQTPIEFLKKIMNDATQKIDLRVKCAVTVAQYEHKKIGEGGKKESRAEAATNAGKGKFGAGSPPKLKAVPSK